MSDFKQYRRSQIAELAEWTQDTDMRDVSVSVVDKEAGSPKPGDMIARNPKNHADRWLVAGVYFRDNFEQLPDPAPAEGSFARGDDGQYRTDPAPAEEGKP